MTFLKRLLGTASLAAAIASSTAFGQMGGPGPGGSGGGPTDMMTNGSEDLFIPAGVRGGGAFSSFFVTDLWIKASTTGTATLYFHAADAASATPAATATVTLTQPITYLPDVIQSRFGLANAFGNIRVSAPFPISATVRVYNQTGAGAYGVAFMGMPSRMAMTAMPMSGSYGTNEYAIYMVGLLPQPGNRVNVNVVNASSTPIGGVVEILDADGTVPSGSGATSTPFTLAGYTNHQFSDVLLNLHTKLPGGDAGLQVRVRLNQGTPGMAMAYAVVNDNTTNDGYVVMGSMMNGGRGMGGGMGMIPTR